MELLLGRSMVILWLFVLDDCYVHKRRDTNSLIQGLANKLIIIGRGYEKDTQNGMGWREEGKKGKMRKG